jgi:hypothetical protein
MPFVLASLIFAVSLSLLPYTEPPEDLPPDSSPRTHFDRLNHAKDGNWRDWTHPLRVHAEDEDEDDLRDPVGDGQGEKRALVDGCPKDSDVVRLIRDEHTDATGEMGRPIEVEMPITGLGLNIALVSLPRSHHLIFLYIPGLSSFSYLPSTLSARC